MKIVIGELEISVHEEDVAFAILILVAIVVMVIYIAMLSYWMVSDFIKNKKK